jgi:hypothetical protein
MHGQTQIKFTNECLIRKSCVIESTEAGRLELVKMINSYLNNLENFPMKERN